MKITRSAVQPQAILDFEKELEEIVRIAALVNKIEYKPAFVYDSWAIINYSSELEKAKRYLPKNQIKTLEKLQSSMEKVDIKSLPHSLVHGDLISTNIMKAKDQIYFVDFSVANYSPRIVELAVLMCDMFFDPSGEMTVQQQYNDLITQYQKYIQLSKEELEVLPLFVKLAHAMHLVRGLREKGEGNTSDENNHWIEIGKNGLEQTLKMWK
jgi:Ser/Thr protein kinase RdoA (MazF antagonist)